MAINNPYSNEPTSKTAEKLLNIQYGNTKEDRLMQESAKKKTALNGGVPPTEADFSILNPNANLEQQKTHGESLAIRQNQEKLQALFDSRVDSIYQPTTLGEDALDVTNSLAQGGIALGEMLYGAADYASRNNLGVKTYENITGDSVTSLDEALGGFSTVFGDVRKQADRLYQSDKQKSIDERRERYGAVETQFSEEQKVKDIANGDSEFWAEVKNIGRQAGDTADSLLHNPSQIVLGALEEIPSIFVGGAVGKSAVAALETSVATKSGNRFLQSDAAKKLIKTIQEETGVKILAEELGEKAAARYVRTEKGAKAAKKAATAAGVGTAAIEEAMSNAMQTKAEVLNLTENDVKDEPAYIAYRESGMSHEKALQELSQKAFDIVTAITLPTAGIVSKVTGAGGLEGSIFLKGSKLANTIFRKSGATVIEGVEEGIQGGTGQTAQNFAAQQTFDQDRNLTEGVGQNIGEGAVIGAGTGAILGAVSTTGEVGASGVADAKVVGEKASDAIKAGAKFLEKATDAPEVKAARKSGDASVVTNTESETYSPVNALTALASEEFFPKRKEEESEEDFTVRTDTYTKELQVHVDKQTANIQELMKKLGPVGKEDPVVAKQVKEELATLKNMVLTKKGIEASIGKTDFDGMISKLKEDPNNKGIILGSMEGGIDSSLSIVQAEKVLKSGVLNEVEVKQVEAFIQIKKSTQEVSKDIREGDKKNNKFGLNDYSRLIIDAVNTGNADNARSTLTQLAEFTSVITDKARQARKAYNEVKSSSDKNARQYPSGKTWSLDIRKDTPEYLITNIEKDAKGLVETFNSLKAYSIAKFNNTGAQTNDVRGNDSTSDGSGTVDTTGSQQSNNVSGGVQSANQDGPSVSDGTLSPVTENGTSDAGRVGNDDALDSNLTQSQNIPANEQAQIQELKNEISKTSGEVEQVPPTATQEEGAGETETNNINSFDNNPTVNTFVNKNRTVVEGQLRDIQFRATYNNRTGKLTNLKTRAAGIRVWFNSPIKSENYPEPNIDSEMGAITDIINSIDPDFKQNEVTNENTQQSNTSSQNTTQQENTEEQTQEVADGTQATGNPDVTGGIIDVIKKTGLGILSKGRAHANRLTKLFNVNPKKNQMNLTTDLFKELDSLEGITEEQRTALERIGKFKELLAQSIDKVVGFKPELNGDNPYAAVDKNMIQLLMTEGSDTYSEGLDPNVLNLMAISAIKWLGTRGKESLTRTRADIGAALGIKPESVTPKQMEHWLDKGIPSFLVTDNLGKDVMDSLGLSLDKNTAPRETKNRMTQSIGGVIFYAMHDMGLLETITEAKPPKNKKPQDDPDMGEIQKNRQNTQQLTKMRETPRTAAASGLFKEVSSVLESITSIENDYKMPSFTAPTKVPEKNNHKTQDLTKSQRKALENYAQKAFKLNTTAMMMFDLIGDKVLKVAMGYDFTLVEEGKKLSSTKTQVTKLHSAKGKNNQIERSIENLKAFKQHLIENGEEGIDSEFFFESVVDDNNRFRMTNKIVTPQGDKLHRAVMIMDGWEYTVDDEESRTLYLLALGQSLGVDIDKLEIDDSIAETLQMINKPEIQNAVNALKKLRDGVPKSPDDEEAIEKGLKLAKQGPHSLEGLISFMDYSETSPFKSTLSIEVDGITNGTALATLLFAPIGSEKVLAKSGIFSDYNRSYGKYISKPENNDNYNTLAQALTTELNSIIAGTWRDKDDKPFDNKLKNLLRPIGNILGNFGTKVNGVFVDDPTYGLVRSIAKNPVLIGNYGAGDAKITAEFVEEVLSKFYQHIEDAVNDKDQARLNLLYNEISNMVFGLPRITLKNGLTWTMNEKQTGFFKSSVKKTYGTIMNAALQKEFAGLREARNNFNTILNATNAMFRSAYNVEARKIMKTKVPSLDRDGKRILDEKGKPVLKEKGYLTIADEEFLQRRLAPYRAEIKHGQVLKGDGPNTHIPLTATENVINKDSRFATEIDVKKGENIPNHPDLTRRVVYAPEITYTSNGVRGTAAATQATDSAVMTELLLEDDLPVLNVYDAFIGNPMQAIRAALRMNKGVMDVTKRSKVYRNAAEDLKRIQVNFSKNDDYMTELHASGVLISEVLGDTGKGPDGETNPMEVVRDALAYTNIVENRRKEMFSKIQHIVQYNLEGGGFSTSSEERGAEYYVKQFVAEVKGSDISALGSTPDSANTNYSQSMTEHEAKANNIVGLMGMLSSLSGVKSSVTHAAYLAELLGDTYNSFVATTKIKVFQGGKLNAGEYRLDKRDIRMATKAGGRASPFEMGADEIFAHEMTHSMTLAGLMTNSLFSREIRRLFDQAKASLTVTDFKEDGGTLAEAEERYNYIFNNTEQINGYSAGIFEFVAFGLTNENFRKILETKVDPNRKLNKDTSFLGKLRAAYSRLLEILTNQVIGTRNISADKKLNMLVGRMMQHEADAKQKVYKASITDKIEDGIKGGLINYIQQPLVDFLRKDAFKKESTSNFRLVRAGVTIGQAAAGIAATSLSGNFGEFKKVINQVAKRLGATENNLFIALLNEVQGRIPENNKFYQLTREARKVIDQARADIASNVKSHVRKQFNRPLTGKEEQALTRVLLKTDMSSLTAGFSAEQMKRLVIDDAFLAQEIRKAEQALNKFGLNATWYRKQANSLANFMVTDEFTEDFGLKNAHAISRLVGLNARVPKDAAQAELVIDKLASLKAIRVTQQKRPDDMKVVVDLFNEEFATNVNPEENGVMFTLMYHADYKERVLDQLFDGNPMQTVKGYIREIYDPNQSFQVAPEADVEMMARDGFVRKGRVGKDPSDPNGLPMAIYVSDMGQLAAWQAGGISLASMTAKGSKYYDTVVNTNAPNNTNVSPSVAITIKRRKEKAARDIYAGVSTPISRTTLVPIIDETGKVTDFHYLMKDTTKEFLNRNIQLSDVFGAMEGNMKSKVAGAEMNNKFVEALTEDFKDNFSKKREQYSFVGLNSDRSDLEELYKMMPIDMRNAIKASTGQDGIWVRDDIIKLVFGQRKFSIAHYFKEKAQLGEANTKLGNMYLNKVYHKLGSPRVAKIEKGWQEIIAWVKDTIVIKSVVTLLGNVASNNVLLWSLGVPIKGIVANQERAVRYAEQYQDNQERLDEIDRQIAVNNKKQDTLINRNKIKALEVEKTRINDKQVTNPIHGLIEAGIYQSIIDDVDMLDDGFSYKTQLEDWVAPVTDKIPSQLKTIGSYVTLSQDNKAYQFLRRSTQLSDFAARFALHEHNLSKGMSMTDSVNMIVDVFIDYDLPTHKGIEYLNSIGGVFFTKFFLRIQKVILYTLQNYPARFFGLHYLQELFGNISDIADSFGLTKDLAFMFKTPIGALEGILDMHPTINLLR